MIQLSRESLINFINSKNPREKKMIIILGIMFLFFADYWLLLTPVTRFFTTTMSKKVTLEREVEGLVHDEKNRLVIQKSLEVAQQNLIVQEASFVTAQEVPFLLESLSNLASESGVKILSVKPQDNSKQVDKGQYSPLPIRIQGLAGTHEFGTFLARLESNRIFFKVKSVRISENPASPRRHMVELEVDAYRVERRYQDDAS